MIDLSEFLKIQKRNKTNIYLDIESLNKSDLINSISEKILKLNIVFDSVIGIGKHSEIIAKLLKNNFEIWDRQYQNTNNIHGRVLVFKYAITDGLNSNNLINKMIDKKLNIIGLTTILDYNMYIDSDINYNYLTDIQSQLKYLSSKKSKNQNHY